VVVVCVVGFCVFGFLFVVVVVFVVCCCGFCVWGVVVVLCVCCIVVVYV